MGVNKINLEDVETNASETILRILIKDVNCTEEKKYYLLLPLEFRDFNKQFVDLVLKEMCKECSTLQCCVQRTNSCMKKLFGYLNDYIDDKGNAILTKGTWKEDKEEVKNELIRVLIKSLNDVHAEVVVNKFNNDYTLIYKNTFYAYDKGNLQLSLVNEARLIDCKHLYGKRIYDFSKKKIISNEIGTDGQNVYLEACSDVSGEDTGKKIEALRTLCDMLKNASDTTTGDQSDYTNEETTEVETEQSRTKQKKEDENIDINDLREKIKRAQEEMQEEKQRTEDQAAASGETPEVKKSAMSEEMQKLFFYFLQNPSMLSKTIDQINNTIDQLTDQLNPNAIFQRRKPIMVRKYFQNVNLVLKYIEMLKIIEMKYKQTIELRVQSEDFSLKNEAKEFNDHLKKIWNMVNLILAELSALKINDFVSTVPQCGNIKFDTSQLFQKDQSYLQSQLSNLGFSTKNNAISTTSIVLPNEQSEALVKNTIIEIQRSVKYAIRQVLQPYYVDLQAALESSCSSSSVSEDNIEAVLDALTNYANDTTHNDLLPTISANSSAGSASTKAKLQVAMAAATNVDVNDIIQACINLASEVYNIVNTIFSYTLDDASNIRLQVLGAYYEKVTTAGNSISSITLQTDNLLGLQYAFTQFTNIDNAFVSKVRLTLKAILGNLLHDANNNTNTAVVPTELISNTITIDEITAAFHPGHMIEFGAGSYNPLSYAHWQAYASTSSSYKVTDIFPIISAGETITAEILETGSKNAWTMYEKILNIVFTSKTKFVTAMTNKAEKTVILERRSRLINFLKQFENDVNLGLSFFGEMATLYNSTTNQNILNATPVCFSQYSANKRGNSDYDEDAGYSRAQPSNQNRQQRAPSPPPMNSPESKTETESSDNEEEFKLPTMNSENRNFYSGSRTQYS
ncbi:hypothetical protein CPAV1605_455 [seawater metagenome]|uniref:Uncharacterized protein n=1 Tax=seawater metagenome TaxID=1561972 RepID=A0A5E8CM16_9ZZZZ